MLAVVVVVVAVVDVVEFGEWVADNRQHGIKSSRALLVPSNVASCLSIQLDKHLLITPLHLHV